MSMVIDAYRFGPAGDPYWANVSALLHMDGSNGGTIFTDETGKTWTRTGNVVTSTAQARFGQSALFDGSGDWLDAPASADFTFGTSAFTLECFFWINTIAGANRGIISFGSNLSLYIASTGSNLYWFDGSTNLLATPTPANNTWHHVAIARQGTTLRMFLNGSLVSSATYSTNIASTNMRIGTATTGSGTFDGYIDEVRITKGVARYTANFTPPSSPFPNS